MGSEPILVCTLYLEGMSYKTKGTIVLCILGAVLFGLMVFLIEIFS